MPLVRLDPVFRALADPTRLWIVEQLFIDDASVAQLAEAHPMSLTAFMRHVAVLEQCGLVRTNKLGRVRDCTVEPEPLCAAEHWLRGLLWARYGARLGSLPGDWRVAADVSSSRNCSTSSSSESMGAEQLLPWQR